MLSFFGKECMPSLNYQAGRPPLVSYPRIFVQNIRSYFPYMEAVFCIGNLKDVPRHFYVDLHFNCYVNFPG